MSVWYSWDSIRPLRWSKEASLPVIVLRQRRADPARRARLMVRRRWTSYRAARREGSIGTMGLLPRRRADPAPSARLTVRRRWRLYRAARRNSSIGTIGILQRRADPAWGARLMVRRRWIYVGPRARAARLGGSTAAPVSAPRCPSIGAFTATAAHRTATAAHRHGCGAQRRCEYRQETGRDAPHQFDERGCFPGQSRWIGLRRDPR